MKDIAATFAFLLYFIVMITINFIIPTYLILLGLKKMKTKQKYGKLILIIGTIYLSISLICFIISMFNFGF